MLCLVLMLIGGSPMGTAGGIKTTTVAVLLPVSYTHLDVYKRQECLLGEDYNDLDKRKEQSLEFQVSKDTPTTFLWHTVTDDWLLHSPYGRQSLWNGAVSRH